MHPKLSLKLSSLSEKSEDLMQDLGEVNLEILQKKPHEKAWSVIQILNHLMVSESSSLNYVRKKFLGVESVGQVGLVQRGKMKVLDLAFNGVRKFKAPVYVSNPSNAENLKELEEKWAEVRSELTYFLEDYPEDYIEKLVYRHPIAGRVSLYQMLDFFIMHMRHHKKQIERTLAAVEVK